MTTYKELEDSDAWKCVTRKGHHKPNSQRYPDNCGCSAQTRGGYAYRDLVFERVDASVSISFDRVRFYHQSDIVLKSADCIKVKTHGWGSSSTTRERINKELPCGFDLVQRDYMVRLSLPSGDLVDVPETFRLEFNSLDDGGVEVTKTNGDKVVDVVR